MTRTSINPRSDADYIDNLDIDIPDNFPKFLQSIKFEPFRHIPNLTVQFKHPISVICGTNRSGKSTILIAIACSHVEFKKRNIHNGKVERQTWKSFMQFTSEDRQLTDWTYHIGYKYGVVNPPKQGQRKAGTKKWNGIAKKQGQFENREVVFIDLDRILPARNFGKAIFNKSQSSSGTPISSQNVVLIETYLSYILEEEFKLLKLAEHIDKDIFKYQNNNEYSSYNAATGEEVLTKIIIEAVEASPKSLILIDEIEVGLHPKVQRRLIEVINNIAKNDQKQFIITSHSPTILSSLPEKSRIFIERDTMSNYKSITGISVNAALSKMDSASYPLFDLFCEDKEAYKIIIKAISSIQSENGINNFGDLVNVIPIGDAEKTYTCFKSHQETYPKKRIKTGYACVLDGDRTLVTYRSKRKYPDEDCLHFIYSSESPEKFLLRAYLAQNPNTTLNYHLNSSNSHCLFDKMVENSAATTLDEAFEICWQAFLSSPEGITYFSQIKAFLLEMAKKFSPDL